MSDSNSFGLPIHRGYGFAARHRVPVFALAVALLNVASVAALQAGVSAQPGAKPAPAHRAHSAHKPVSAATQAKETPASPAAPAAPVMPKWPVNDSPGQPSVTWDSHGLRINAQNSSLRQILDQVSVTTGAKVEGFGADQRVFGDYGPGQTRDILSQLLQGSGYNVLMIGDQGQGTPRQIVLSARRAGDTVTPAVRNPDQDNQDDEPDAEPEQQPASPPPMLRPPVPPSQRRGPQQLFEQMQEQQRQMRNSQPPQ